MIPLGRRLSVAGLVCLLTGVSVHDALAQSAQNGSTSASAATSSLQTFTIAKPPELIKSEQATDTRREPLRLPRAHDSLRTTVGLGYVQAADWGTELAAMGDIKGLQVQTSALITKGTTGFLLDNGVMSLFDPDRLWRIEGGDVFSNLRGASRGARVSWAAAGDRRPGISLYGPRRGTPNRSTVVSYRDQIIVRGQTLIDAEAATDKSYFLRSRLGTSRVEVEGSYRSNRRPVASRDGSVFAGVAMWRGISLSAGLFRSSQLGERADWKTVSLRLPVSRFLSLTLERTFTETNDTANTSTAAMANVTAGQLRFFHRHQFGEFDRVLPGFSESIERQQTQSMASYGTGRRLNLMLQLATQRTESGVMQHWEELQATVALTRSSTLRLVTAIPDVGDEKRMRAYFRQELPWRFALQADYGRLSAYQDVPFELDRSRFKVMLYKTWNIATPTRGAEVSGRVIDQTGRPVKGARVKLGTYEVETDAGGAYLFKNVPRGEYELTLDKQFLPADYAWDDRRLNLTVNRFSRMKADLLVAPLNALHGRVYADLNGNQRFDRGEGIARVVIQLNDRVTASDADGAYSFYNLSPGKYAVRLYVEKLPAEFESASPTELQVELGEAGPATGVDFRVRQKSKPIIFNNNKAGR